MIGNIEPSEAAYMLKDLIGDASAAENESQREVLKQSHIAVAAGKEIVVDLHCNNGKSESMMRFGEL